MSNPPRPRPYSAESSPLSDTIHAPQPAPPKTGPGTSPPRPPPPTRKRSPANGANPASSTKALISSRSVMSRPNPAPPPPNAYSAWFASAVRVTRKAMPTTSGDPIRILRDPMMIPPSIQLMSHDSRRLEVTQPTGDRRRLLPFRPCCAFVMKTAIGNHGASGDGPCDVLRQVSDRDVAPSGEITALQADCSSTFRVFRSTDERPREDSPTPDAVRQRRRSGRSRRIGLVAPGR